MSTLRSRIFLVFALLFVAVLTVDQLVERYGLPILSFEGRNKEIQREVFRALDLTADLKKERLLLWINERRADSIVIAESPPILTLLKRVEDRFHEVAAVGNPGAEVWADSRKGTDYRELRRHIEVMKDNYRAYDRIDLVDLPSGVILVSTDEKYLGAYIYDDDVSLAGLSSLGDYRVKFWRHLESDVLDVHFARPITLPGEQASSLVLILHINTRHFFEPLLHTGDGLGESGEALLVDQDSRVLVPLKFPLPGGTRARALEYRITAQPAQRAAKGEEGIIAAKDYRGVPVLAAYRSLEVAPGVRWGLVVKRDQEEVFRSYRREDLLSLAFMGLGLLFAIACTFLLADSLARPIMRVSDTARRIRNGDVLARADLRGTEEVQVLGEAFNSMVDRLEEYTEELQEKNDELEAFVYTAAHDLKNPLIGAQGLLTLLGRSLSGQLDQKQRELMERTSATLERFERILTDLLEYSRVRAGALEAGSVSIDTLVERIREEQGERIKGTGATIRLQEGLPEIRVNESRAYQLFSNLISNSLKFTREGVKPEIEIGKVSRPGEAVPETQTLFFIADNGVGIEQEWIDKIFDLFTRVDSTIGEGTGTGLAIVKRIIRQLGGRIWAESSPGSGTTFYFTLPTAG